jgi:hypothetical protein
MLVFLTYESLKYEWREIEDAEYSFSVNTLSITIMTGQIRPRTLQV